MMRFLSKFYDSGTQETLVLNLVSGAALLLAAAWFSYSLFSVQNADIPSRVVNSIKIEPTILLPGKPFNVHINVTINKLCPYEVHWSLVRSADNVEVVRIIEPVKQPPDQIGTFDLPPIPRYIPASVPPGEYKYFLDIADICTPGHTTLSARKGAEVIVR